MAAIPTWPGWYLIRTLGRGSLGPVYEICRADERGETVRAALEVIPVVQDPTAERRAEELLAAYRNMIERERRSGDAGPGRIVRYEDCMAVRLPDGGGAVLVRTELLTPLEPHDLPEETLFRLGCDLCRALEWCGLWQLRRGEIRPEQVYAAPDGGFLLGGFAADELPHAGSPYQAPECAAGGAAGPASAVYSVGVLLNRFLHTGAPADGPRSAQLRQVVRRAMAQDPAQRFPSPSALREALEAAQRGAWTDGAKPERAASVRRDLPLKIAAGLLSVCVVLLLATVLGQLFSPGSGSRDAAGADTGSSAEDGGGADDFADSAVEPDTESAQYDRQCEDIDALYAALSAQANDGAYQRYRSSDGLTSYWEGDAPVLISLDAETDGLGTDTSFARTFCLQGGTLVYACYRAEDAVYRFYLSGGELFRCVEESGAERTVRSEADFLREWTQRLAEESAAAESLARAARQDEEPSGYADGIYFDAGVFHISSGRGLAVYRDIVNGGNETLVRGWSETQAPNNCNYSQACLDNDISMRDALGGSAGWDCIGSDGMGFYGTFDGKGHCIRDFDVVFDSYDVSYIPELDPDGVDGGVGLFAMNDGTIQNLALSGSITSSVRRTGGLAGINRGVVSHCVVDVDIRSSEQYLGGVVGVNEGETDSYLTHCANFGDLTNTWSESEDGAIEPKTGGITGGNWHNGYLTSCYNVGTITVESFTYTGGLAGKLANEDSISHSWYPEYCCYSSRMDSESLLDLSDFSFSFEEADVYSDALSALHSDEWYGAEGEYPELYACPTPEDFYD